MGIILIQHHYSRAQTPSMLSLPCSFPRFHPLFTSLALLFFLVSGLLTAAIHSPTHSHSQNNSDQPSKSTPPSPSHFLS